MSGMACEHHFRSLRSNRRRSDLPVAERNNLVPRRPCRTRQAAKPRNRFTFLPRWRYTSFLIFLFSFLHRIENHRACTQPTFLLTISD